MTLIASVLHLDRQAIKALKITSPYSLHRVVYSLFEDVRSEQEKQASNSSGLLYAEQGGDYKSRKILLLSNRPPKERVDGLYGEVQSKAISDSFLHHTHYRFKVIVNPTKRDSASKKLVPIRGREAVHDWFAERAKTSWGFEVTPAQLQVDSINVLQFKDKNQCDITMAQAQVQGTLQVTDEQQFINSFRQGIGRGRAFGCGLLQLVPLLENPFA